MGRNTQKQVGPKLGQGEQYPSLDPKSLSLSLFLSLSLISCLRAWISLVLGL